MSHVESDEIEEDKIRRITDFLTTRMDQVQSYHNHKETMAHACLLVQLAFLTAIFSARTWPPCWIPDMWICSSKHIALVCVILIWLLTNGYIRWQLIHRRFAAVFLKSALIILRKWANTPPSNQESEANEKEPWNKSWFYSLVDHFLPCKQDKYPLEEGLAGYPKDLVIQMKKVSTQALTSEWFIWFGSLFVLIGMLVRTISA